MPILKQHQYAHLAIAAAVVTIALKSVAYIVTSSVGLLSDAMESLVNLATALLTLWLIKVSLKPEDDEHQFGHTKAQYFSSLAEGLFIFLAAGGILFTAIARLFHPEPLSDISLGILISTIASIVNGGVALVMIRGSKHYNSPALFAEGKHLMTDVYTSAGVILGIIIVGITKIDILDPVIAILVALHILHTAWTLISGAINGLMDCALEKDIISRIEKTVHDSLISRFDTLEQYNFSLKSRQSASLVFVYLTLYLPSTMSLGESSNIATSIEKDFKTSYPLYSIFINIKPDTDITND